MALAPQEYAIENPAWYLLQCKSRQGFRALEHLQNQGYHGYLPEISVERIIRQQGVQKRVQQQEPLFPGYLFIRLGLQDNWAPIRSTRGVNRFVAFNGQPARVADAIIEQIQQRISNAEPAPLWQAGDVVRLQGAAFADIEAVFQCFDGDERAIILLTLLQREQTIAVPVSAIKRI